MFQQPEIMRMAQAMAQHAAQRQNAVAQNVANADTPGYAARDLAPFAEAYAAEGMALRQTRPGHLGAEGSATASMIPRADPGNRSPNGNSVSLESEMVKSVLAATELAVETAVTLRDKVVEAYQEILRMPV